MTHLQRTFVVVFQFVLGTSCLSPAPEGLHPIASSDVTVKMDFEHRPLRNHTERHRHPI